ncbi:cytochrome P450 [Micromonospora rifamycinica]|uniref:cytochrome P450 n=1 Tax=Micromonospora rifamycinica TaxID=291594 RepID=UPI00341A301E
MTDVVSDSPPEAGRPEGNRFPMPRTGCPYDPPPEYARLRAEEPVTRAVMPDGRTVWLVTRHADVQAAMSDPRISVNLRSPGFPAPGAGPALPADMPVPLFRTEEHDAYRKLLLPHFTVRRIRAMRPQVQQIVDDVLDQMIAAGPPADLVEALALPVPSMVICDLLGAPYTDHEFFQTQAQTALSHTSTPEQVGAALGELRTYLAGLLDERRRKPTDDLLTKLVEAQAQYGSRDPDVVATAQALITAGHETTANMISLGTLVLREHPQTLAELVRAPEGWPAAVEELLRYLSIGDLIAARAATDDVEIGGRTIHAGDGMFLLIGSANRDEAVFEDPEAFDVTRASRHHLALGFGVHQCLGQHLARLELEVVFETLFRRLPELRITSSVGELEFKTAAIFGLQSLPVSW